MSIIYRFKDNAVARFRLNTKVENFYVDFINRQKAELLATLNSILSIFFIEISDFFSIIFHSLAISADIPKKTVLSRQIQNNPKVSFV